MPVLNSLNNSQLRVNKLRRRSFLIQQVSVFDTVPEVFFCKKLVATTL